MRELKFRYWNGVRMIQPEDISFIDFNNKFVDYFDTDTQEYKQEKYCNRFPILQYTEKKDKSGMDIFDGDVIDAGYICPLSNEKIIEIYIIECNEYGTIAKRKGYSPYGDTLLKFFGGNSCSCNVIGNIYKNPELLEVK